MRDADGKLAFHAPAPPTTTEVTEVAVRTAKRLQKVLARHGRLLEDATVDTGPKAEQLALSALVGAAASALGLGRRASRQASAPRRRPGKGPRGRVTPGRQSPCLCR